MNFEVWAIFQDMQNPTSSTPPSIRILSLAEEEPKIYRQRRASKGRFHIDTFKGLLTFVYTEERKWIAESSQPHSHKDNRNIIKQRAPLTYEQLSQPVAAICMFSLLSFHLSISDFLGKAWHLSGSQAPHQEKGANTHFVPVCIQRNDRRSQGLPTLFLWQQHHFHPFMFWASTLGFIWGKGSTTGTFLAFFLRQGLAHLHLVPTGSVNDPSLASQAIEQQGGPRNPRDGKERVLSAPKVASPGYSLKTKERQLTCLLSSGAFKKSALITAMV